MGIETSRSGSFTDPELWRYVAIQFSQGSTFFKERRKKPRRESPGDAEGIGRGRRVVGTVDGPQ